jgi:amino acid transporter
MYIPASVMDIDSGRRSIDLDPDFVAVKKTWRNAPMRVIRALF